MVLLLLKSTACMAIFWIFYKLLLEKEAMHVFKRFYLLGALAASFIIPSLVFTEYIEIAPVEISPQLPVDGSFDNTATDLPVAPEPATFNYQILLWVLYGLGVFGFGLRFARHLSQIWHRIRKNPKLRKNFIIQVLLQEQLPPHTFFNYIFLNKKKFDNNEIPETVLLHEETHAKQKHSIDVLVLELLQVLLWFNPFIYLYKHAAKLNHEFLADLAVLNKNKNLLQYQNTLLSYLSHDSYTKHQSTGISSAINYSSIKKRFIIMKKRTSKKAVVLRFIFLLPITFFLVVAFSNKNISYKYIDNVKIADVFLDIDPNSNIKLNNEDIQLTELPNAIRKINPTLSIEEKKKYLFASILYSKDSQIELVDQISIILIQNNIVKVSAANLSISELKNIKPTHYKNPLAGLSLTEAEKKYKQIAKKKPIKESKNGDFNISYDVQTIAHNNATSGTPSIELFKKWKDPETYALWLDGKHITNSSLNSYDHQQIVHYESSFVYENARSKKFPQPYQVSLYTSEGYSNTNKENEIYININDEGNILLNDLRVDLEDFETTLIKTLNNIDINRSDIPFIINFGQNSPKETIDYVINIIDSNVYNKGGINYVQLDEQAVKTYNRLAKKYNAVAIEKRIIPLKDLKILEKIYRKMSASQKKNAQPFPECNIQGTVKEIDIKVNKDGLLLIDSQLLQVDELKEHLKSMNTPKTYEERQKSLRVLITTDIDAPKDVLRKLDQIVSEFGAATVNIYGKEIGFQESPTTKQIKEYNDLAKKYNSMIAKGGDIRILKSDVDRLRYIYNLMSDKQKKDAAPFPDFPEPPPAPKAPEAPNSTDYADAEIEKIINNKDIIAVENTQVYIHNSNFIESNRSSGLMESLKTLAKQDAQFYLDGEKISAEEGFSVVSNEKDITIETLPYSNKQPEVRIYKDQDDVKIPPPPSPPTPISPLDFVIDAAKKGATFLYEGKEVSSDKAIDLIKNNKELNIESRGKNGNTVVKITKAPVTIK